MRELRDHHLMNPDMFVDAYAVDEPHAVNNGNHHYEFQIGGAVVGELKFQNGPRTETESIPGVLEGAVVSVLLDRLRGFQAGPFGCRENAIVITKLEEALAWMDKRAAERRDRGVLGKNEK